MLTLSLKLLQFVIIGCGNIAKRHAEQIQTYGKLVAVCDIIRSRAEELGKKYNADVFSSIEELFAKKKGIDVAVICTPNGLHAVHSIISLQAGCHVLCEKPMAINSSDCLAMIQEAEKAGKHLFVVKQNRFNPPVVAVKKLLDEKKLGNIYSIQLNCFWNRDAKYYENSWKGTNMLDGGTLFTQFSHFIDLLYWMIGDVKHVRAFKKNYAHQHIIEFEDTGVVILEFANGVMGTINYTVNSFQKNMEGSLAIFGEKGTVKIGGQYLNVLEYQQIQNHVISPLPAGSKANEYGFYQGSMSNHDKVYQNLSDVIHNNAKMAASSRDGWKTVEIIEKIYAAAENIN
ncbi:MAG: Gfo/Idh/MocA family oxidoreductase [Bacteroidetes bacterium]|nr:MAG: Gfo/Idh/MocA family oxidoreductase [Bacteroidota bacterium]